MTAVGETDRAVLETYLSLAGEQERHLALSLTRTRSHAGRDVLAALALPRRSAVELEGLAVEYVHGDPSGLSRFAQELTLPAALEYAHTVAAQNLQPTDHDVARGLLAAVVDVHGEIALDRRAAELLLQLRLKGRDFDAAERVLTTGHLRRTVRELATVDVANPWIRPGRDEATWLERLNTQLYGGLVPVALLPHGPSPFDRLTVAEHRPVRHECRITVIMSAYNPDHHLVTAVRSVVEQTWENIELLVVDDASPSPAPGVLEEVERMDPRVRVIRKRHNGGTYRARNTALAEATGDFFTCLDSDDWAHPQRLELGVRPLLEDRALMATRGSGVRATQDVELSRVARGGRIVAASSLMVRTFPGLNRLGFFDPVRKSADAEYALRLEAAFGGRVVDLPRWPLTVLLASDESLSAADFAPGWRHPARAEYDESQLRAHTEIAEGRRRPFLDPDGPRLFPAPRRWERHPQDGRPGPPLDLCVVADWREGCLDETTVDYVARAAADGAVVGVVHVESLHDMRPSLDPVAPALRELIAGGVVERVYLDDDRVARTVVVADPRPFQFPGEVAVGLRPTSVVVRSIRAAEQAGQYDRGTTDRHLTATFELTPGWTDELPVITHA